MLDGFEEDTIEFLDILLLEGLLATPLEAADEAFGGDGEGVVGVLEFGEEELELVEDGVLGGAVVGGGVGPLVEGGAEAGGHEEGLKEGVHVAGGADVGQAFVEFGGREGGLG